MASCCASVPQHSQPRDGEKAMAKKLNKWAEEGLLPSKPTWNRQNPNADPVQCGKYRPDFVFESDLGVVISEYDEHQHSLYKQYCELSRMLEVSYGYNQRPVHWIRYNPDFFHTDSRVNTDSQTRDATHLQQLQSALKTPDYEHFITIEYLFYRPMFGGQVEMVQKFQFATAHDYLTWLNTVSSSQDLSVPSYSKRKPIKNSFLHMTRESAKRNWLITYGASCQSITHAMLDVHHIRVDECYTLVQRDLKYTLIHVPDRLRIASVDSFLKSYAIVQQEIFGYDALTRNKGQDSSTIECHPGFMLIVEHLNTGSQLLEQWPSSPKQNGLLWRHWNGVGIECLSRNELMNRLRVVEQELTAERKARRESDERAEILATESDELRRENKRLCRQILNLEGDVKALRCFLRTSPPHTHARFVQYRSESEEV